MLSVTADMVGPDKNDCSLCTVVVSSSICYASLAEEDLCFGCSPSECLRLVPHALTVDVKSSDALSWVLLEGHCCQSLIGIM